MIKGVIGDWAYVYKKFIPESLYKSLQYKVIENDDGCDVEVVHNLYEELDTGIVALLDYRFGYSSYRQLFPREWKNIKRVSIDTVFRELELFWNA